jgi:uncharacterized protein (TIGR03000 family)
MSYRVVAGCAATRLERWRYYLGYYYPYGAYRSTYAYLYNAYPYDTYSYYAYPYQTVGASAGYLPDYYAGYNPELSTYPSYYPPTAETAVPADTRAYLTVAVPADAQVWVGDQPTSQTGTVHQFYSPPLTPGQNFTYEIRARWREDGRCRSAPEPGSPWIAGAPVKTR